VSDLPERVRSLTDLASLHDDHHADVTVACLGLGAHALGDRRLAGRLGVLVSGPLPTGTVHAERAVVDDDDALYPRYTVPHADHLHLGGTYLPVDDPADWDAPERLAERARAEVPGILADAAERFPALDGWRPTGEPWWGIRPVRDTVALGRVDPTLAAGRDVVVSHGWGGSGWTIGPAVAEEVARSLLPDPHAGLDDPLAAYGWWRP
jgi:glycine/D-amino acid oxidase-like deaminating enzyme